MKHRFLRRWLFRRRKTSEHIALSREERIDAAWAIFQRNYGYDQDFQWGVIRQDRDHRIQIGRTLLPSPKTAHITRIIPNFEETVADQAFYWNDAEKTLTQQIPGRDAYATEPMKLR